MSNHLLGFVIAYWVISVGIGLWAAKRVHNSKDFAVAGRSLPMAVVTATVFATWFGSETVLGIPATFLKENLGGVVSDPFGSSLCLILVGMFFARKLYRMNLLTIGDFYRIRYGRAVELLTSICVVISYLGWVSAQLAALGLVFNVVSGGEISTNAGIIIGSVSVLVYTVFGGMWSVAITDFIQMIIIVIGLMFIGFVVDGKVDGGVSHVINQATQTGKFDFFPKEGGAAAWIGFIAAFLTMAFGSIPQQDVFQRVASAKNEKISSSSSILGGVLYFFFAFIPIFIAYSATMIDGSLVEQYLNQEDKKEAQKLLPVFIMHHVPMFAQIMFFGALLSAIKSCASATLLAPSITFSENIIKPFMKNVNDKKLLLSMRIVLIGFTVLVTLKALYSENTIFQMVEEAYKVTLVGAFIPLVCGLYWKRSTTLGGLLAIILGLGTWLLAEYIAKSPEQIVEILKSLGSFGSILLDGFAYDEQAKAWKFWFPPQLLGLGFSMVGMIVGSLLPLKNNKPRHHLVHHEHSEQHAG